MPALGVLQVRADNAELRRSAERLRAALAEAQEAGQAATERLSASEAAWGEHETAQAARLEELANEVPPLSLPPSHPSHPTATYKTAV
jgi:uncharacterized protein YPO0396